MEQEQARAEDQRTEGSDRKDYSELHEAPNTSPTV
jgi:hypothetical protein